MKRWSNGTVRGHRSVQIRFNVTLSTTYLKCTDQGFNPVLCGEKPTTNRPSHGAASVVDSYSNLRNDHLLMTDQDGVRVQEGKNQKKVFSAR